MVYQYIQIAGVCTVVTTFACERQILSDTKDLQKEINGLTGKLDRTFAVTDELVFKVSPKKLSN